jgi:hypothetical protein
MTHNLPDHRYNYSPVAYRKLPTVLTQHQAAASLPFGRDVNRRRRFAAGQAGDLADERRSG